MAESFQIAKIIELLNDPTDLTWVSIAYLLENQLEQLNLPHLVSYFQQQYSELQISSSQQNPASSSSSSSDISNISTTTSNSSPSIPDDSVVSSPTSQMSKSSPICVQELLNKKITTIQSKKSMIVHCFKNFTLSKSKSTKQKVNCFGAALLSYFISVVNGITCQFYSSETHCWIEIYPQLSSSSHCNHDNNTTSDGGEGERTDFNPSSSSSSSSSSILIDVADNLKAMKRSRLPLSIYFNPQRIDSFGLCLMLICNENPLSDNAIFTILHHYQEKLKYSWEISKYFSLSQEIFSSPSSPPSQASLPSQAPLTLPSVTILDKDSNSFELLFQKVSYHLSNSQYEQMIDNLQLILHLSTVLCQEYSVNNDLWIEEDSSLLALAEDICESFQSHSNGSERDREGEGEREGVQRRYEEWIESVIQLCQHYSTKDCVNKLKKQLPMMSGKRRRIEREVE